MLDGLGCRLEGLGSTHLWSDGDQLVALELQVLQERRIQKYILQCMYEYFSFNSLLFTRCESDEIFSIIENQ